MVSPTQALAPLLLLLLLLLAVASQAAAAAKRNSTLWACTIRNKLGMEVEVTNAGATIRRLTAPDKNGKYENIVLGYRTLEENLNTSTYFGALLGRYANRIGGATYTLDGVTYHTTPNDGNNTLHGGPGGLSHQVWNMKCNHTERSVRLTYVSPPGDGWPGEVLFTVTYTLAREANDLYTHMQAATNQSTPINLAQHTYWNLLGNGSNQTILGHSLTLPNAAYYTPADPNTHIPTGAIVPIAGTPFDFLTPHAIGARFAQLPDAANGYDNNWVLFNRGADVANHTRNGMAYQDAPRLAAKVYQPSSGRLLQVLTTAPGLQVYTGNSIVNGSVGTDGATYSQYSGLALEAQGFPNAPNQPNFPSTIVGPQQPYSHKLIFRLSVA